MPPGIFPEVSYPLGQSFPAAMMQPALKITFRQARPYLFGPVRLSLQTGRQFLGVLDTKTIPKDKLIR